MNFFTSYLIGVFVLAVVFSPVQSKYKEEVIPSGTNLKVFSSEEMKSYDGSDPDNPIYMAVKGVVFDVSTGKDFYGKGASYNALAGKDASKGVAKMSLDPADLTHDVSDLSESELNSLEDIFQGTYKPKYPTVGYMDYLEREAAVDRDL